MTATADRSHIVTLIPGDGIGPEVTRATVAIVEAAGRRTGARFDWHTFAAGAEAYEKTREYIPKALYDSIDQTRVALKGPVATPIGGGFSSINVTLRKRFDLFANFRPVRNLPGVPSRYDDIDLIIVRENTEGLYVGLEQEIVPGVATALKVVTEKGSTRIARFAFDYARRFGRKRLHAIHKANIMKKTDGLFLKCSQRIAAEYPEITYAEHIIDNCCMQLVINPWQYDVLLTENLYGDILSDLCSGLVGGLGLVPGANLGTECAIFEAVHGSAPDIAGKDLANPTALLQSAVLMLRHLKESAAADLIDRAILDVYTAKRSLTRDVGGQSGTSAFQEAILAALERVSA